MNKFKYTAVVLLVAAAGAAFAQPANPFARPVEQPAPPPVVVPPPVQAMPAPAPAPGMPGAPAVGPGAAAPAPAAIATGKQTVEEEVTGSRVGTVNGIHIYRGSNAYVFEKASEKEIVRKLTISATPAAAVPVAAGGPAPAGSAAPVPRDLPSSVGRPAPKK